MIAKLVAEGIRHRWMVLILVMAVAGLGVYAFQQLPIDAYPDIAGQTAWVIAAYPGRAPEEVERQVTIPIEIAMRKVPNVEAVRSQTIFGLSLVQLIIVDGAVIMAENIARRLGEAAHGLAAPGARRPRVLQLVLAASQEVERPVFFSMMMVIVAYVPLLSLTSIEGLLFRPMALTMVYALVGALLFALFAVPVLAAILFPRGYAEWENPLFALARSAHAAVLRGLIACRWLAAAATVCVLLLVGWRVAPRLGIEFLPYLDEGPIWVKANFPEGPRCSRPPSSASGFARSRWSSRT
jgi:cobalt-zinc-cadmium resistance protein CzcA